MAYTSSEAHESVTKAFEVLGFGSSALRHVPVNADCTINLAALRTAIQADRLSGLTPFCIIATAGTVNTGAVDDLEAVARICVEEGAWFHVDGAFGALAVLDESLKHLVSGIELADSIAYDFHKWMYVQYDAGCVLVRRGDLHRAAFSTRPAYLEGSDRGLAGGGTWFCEYGIELSRSFRALKVWFALKEFGALLVFVLVVGSLASAAIAFKVTKRGLRPLKEMTSSLNEFGPESLHERIPPHGAACMRCATTNSPPNARACQRCG